MKSENRTRGRPRTLDRRSTIEFATDCYWREGPLSLGVNEFCRRAGISKPGLYREFGGEDGLMLAALNHYRGTVLEQLYELLESDRPFGEVLEGLVVWYTSERDLPPGCLFAKMRASLGQLGPATTRRVEAIREEQRSAFEIWFGRAVAKGEAKDSIPPSLAAYFLDTQLTSVTKQMAAGESPDMVRAMAELALTSLLPQ